MSETLLELAGISKTYPGVRALDEVSLSVHRGEVLGLIGENGAGKSTLMRVLGGVIAPSEGVIIIDGKDYTRMTIRRAQARRHRLRAPGAEPVRESRRRVQRLYRAREVDRRPAEAGGQRGDARPRDAAIGTAPRRLSAGH